MSIESIIRQKLILTFQPEQLFIENESHFHHSEKGAESHFKVIIVADCFSTQSVLSRHRAVYQCLEDELNNNIHALALHTYTHQEWLLRDEQKPRSTRCASQYSHVK